MNVLLLNHKNQLIQFECSNFWLTELMLGVEIYSQDPSQVQEYLEKCLSPNCDFVSIAQLTKPAAYYDLKDKNALKNISALDFVVSDNLDEVSNIYPGLAVIDCVNRHFIYLGELDYDQCNCFHRDNLAMFYQLYKNKPRNYENSYFKNEKENWHFVKKLEKMFECDYFINYKGMEYKSVRKKLRTNNVIQEIHNDLKKIIQDNNLNTTYDHTLPNSYIVPNPSTTNWQFSQEMTLGDEKTHTLILQTLIKSGIILTQEQEKCWLDYYQKMDLNFSLDLSFLSIAREKEKLNSLIDCGTLDIKSIKKI